MPEIHRHLFLVESVVSSLNSQHIRETENYFPSPISIPLLISPVLLPYPAQSPNLLIQAFNLFPLLLQHPL